MWGVSVRVPFGERRLYFVPELFVNYLLTYLLAPLIWTHSKTHVDRGPGGRSLW